MAVEHINETDTLNQGRIKINAILDQSNASSEKVDGYKAELFKGIDEAKQIATTAGEEAKQIATTAGEEANEKADKAISDSKTAIQTANQAVGTANQNKQDFDALRNEFDDLVAESGDSNPEIVQARTDTEGIKQSTLQARLTRDFSNRMTTSEAIKMFSGAVNTPQMMSFVGKNAGNVSTNANQAFSDYTATILKKPSANWNEMSQENYNKLAGRDDSGVSTGSTQNGVIPQQMYKMNVVEAIKTLAPKIFEGKTLEESIQYVKDIFISFTISVRGKASSPNNNNLKVATYLESADSYTTQLQDSAKEYNDFTIEINDNNFIDSTGIINLLVYSDSSNGVTSSNIDIDYLGVQILVSLNPLSVLETSGFVKNSTLQKHINNNTNPHKVTKDQVGLGQVDNFATATQSAAEIGTADNLFMTPLRTFQAIKKWVTGKFISLTENETVTGIKNFQDGLQFQGESVVSDKFISKTVKTTNTTDFTSDSLVIFHRWGRFVIANIEIQNKSDNFAGWKNLIAFPDGYGPASIVGWGGALTNKSNRNPALSVYANANGIQVMAPTTGLPKGQSCSGTVAYFTNDSWPS